MQSVRIVDATLREGAQAPGVRFARSEAVAIARMLDAVGVDMIECGHALVGEDVRARIAALAELGLNARLLSHARARESDVRAVAASGAGWVGVFCGVNETARRTRLGGRPVETVLDMIRRSVALAKSLGLGVRYTIEDGTRTGLDLVLAAFRAAVEQGADRVCYADTLGSATPAAFGAAIAAIRSALPGTALEVHVHDDRGFAMANAWTAIEAGADWISTSVNGLGERCGVTDLALLLANLDLAGLRPLAGGETLQRLSEYVAAVSCAPPDARRPVVGRHAFTQTARLHALATRRDPRAYLVFDPDALGREAEDGLAGPSLVLGERDLERMFDADGAGKAALIRSDRVA